jgi:hypothetical protein
MKKTYSFFFFLSFLFCLGAHAQQYDTFVIKSKGTVTDITPYVKALQSADMTADRYLNKRRTFKFTTGVEVELLSANELTAQGIKVNTSLLCTKKESDPDPIYSLSPSGYILKGFPSHGKVSKN